MSSDGSYRYSVPEELVKEVGELSEEQLLDLLRRIDSVRAVQLVGDSQLVDVEFRRDES
jgi:hypothetical protein